MLAASDTVHDRHRGAATEGRRSGGCERHGGGPGVDVGGGGGVLAVEDLGSQVAGRTKEPTGDRQAGVVGEPGQAEVDEHRRAPLEQHVGGLDVAVQDTDGVHGEHGFGEAGREEAEVVTVEEALLLDVLVQREPGDVARRHERGLAPGVGVDDLGDPRASDSAERGDLAGEPLTGFVVADDVRPQHLECDAVAVGRLREVHDPHATLADLGEKTVVADAQLSGWRRTQGAGGPHRTTVTEQGSPGRERDLQRRHVHPGPVPRPGPGLSCPRRSLSSNGGRAQCRSASWEVRRSDNAAWVRFPGRVSVCPAPLHEHCHDQTLMSKVCQRSSAAIVWTNYVHHQGSLDPERSPCGFLARLGAALRHRRSHGARRAATGCTTTSRSPL